MLNMYQFAFRSFVLLCFCNFWSPALLSSYAYVNFFKLALVNHANYSHGAPKWIAAYAQRLLLDLAVQVFFFFLVFWHSVSHGMALLLVFLLEMVHVLTYLRSILQLLGLANSTPVTLLASKTLVPLTALVIRYHIFPALATRAKWAKLVQLPAARTVARNMISHQLQAARHNPFGHQPPVLPRSGRHRIHAFAVKMGDTAQQQQALASVWPRTATLCKNSRRRRWSTWRMNEVTAEGAEQIDR
ncbi:hypothetical protein PF008_g14689 [Phytophthora fragariae]|uniref:Uncharacterized protein n=1 Tax=Phytophthora fragariae TaxID=53985 RepID=A0A6G0RGT0_9STRA|nr:hypothetical protein PF008_g14689 [Phytophthora fragariae]